MARSKKGLFFLSGQGFTLVEVLITLVIFSIMAAIALPNWSTLLPTFALNSAARQVQSELHKTKSRAVSENISFQFNVPNAPTNNYEINSGGATLVTVPLPDGIDITQTVTISFTSRGTASNSRVRLKNSKSACKQVVVSTTGRIRTCEPSSCGVDC